MVTSYSVYLLVTFQILDVSFIQNLAKVHRDLFYIYSERMGKYRIALLLEFFMIDLPFGVLSYWSEDVGVRRFENQIATSTVNY